MHSLSTGRFGAFDRAHWQRVQIERRRLGLPGCEEAGQVIDHPLTGRDLFDSATGRRYRVRSVRKQWSQGWYHTAWLAAPDGTNRTVVIGNLGSTDRVVEQQLDRFTLEFVACA